MSRNNRTEARTLLMQMIFQMEAQKDFSQEAADKFTELNPVPQGQSTYFSEQYAAVRDHIPEIDEMIDASNKEWRVSRMPKVDLAICRLAASEILYNDKIPDKVSINEAVDMAKKFGEAGSYRFVNGVLGSIYNSKS